jgi:uncharacterized protein with HEPN domain
MPPEKGDASFLWDMLDACERIGRYIAGRTEADFIADDFFRSAVERQIEIVGEAARHVSAALRDSHPEVPWRAIMAQRHVLAHEYGDIQPSLIWRVAKVHVPSLADQLRGLLPPSN